MTNLLMAVTLPTDPQHLVDAIDVFTNHYNFRIVWINHSIKTLLKNYFGMTEDNKQYARCVDLLYEVGSKSPGVTEDHEGTFWVDQARQEAIRASREQSAVIIDVKYPGEENYLKEMNFDHLRINQTDDVKAVIRTTVDELYERTEKVNK